MCIVQFSLIFGIQITVYGSKYRVIRINYDIYVRFITKCIICDLGYSLRNMKSYFAFDTQNGTLSVAESGNGCIAFLLRHIDVSIEAVILIDSRTVK